MTASAISAAARASGAKALLKSLHMMIGPALVLLVTAVLVITARWIPALKPHLAAHGDALQAWYLFWFVMLGLGFADWLIAGLHRLAGRDHAAPDLVRTIVRVIIGLVALFLILKNVLNYNIAPLLASTALVTAVVGFALQGVLGNVLAGISLHLARSYQAGDWIAIDDKEGRVVEINWRETRLRGVDGKLWIIPHSVAATSRVHNISQPDSLRRHEIFVSAAVQHPPAEVEAAIVEAARSVPDVATEPAPRVFIEEIADWGLKYRLHCWTHTLQDRNRINGTIRHRIWYQFQRRGIRIPFPEGGMTVQSWTPPPGGWPVSAPVAPKPAVACPGDARAAFLESDFAKRFLSGEDGQLLVRPEAMESVFPLLRCELYTAGEPVFRQGDAGHDCYIVTKGRLAGEVHFEGTAEPHRFQLGPGALFGEMGLFLDQPRSATVTAEEETHLMVIPREALGTLLSLGSHPPEKIAQLIASRVAENTAAQARLQESATVLAQRKDSILSRLMKLIR